MSDSIKKLETWTFEEVLVGMNCGEFADLACLCDETVWKAIDVLKRKFSSAQIAALRRRMCACNAPPPVVTTPTPVLGPPVVIPPPTTLPPLTVPTPQCPEVLPAPGTFSGGNFDG